MKKQVILILALCSLSVQAQLPATFIDVLEKFSQEKKLRYIAENHQQNGYISYKFSTDADCQNITCADLRIYYSMDSYCVPDTVGLFGELPFTVAGKKALFVSPITSDQSSQTHDFMRIKVNDGCYELSMGKQGSHYELLLDLASRLVVAQ